MTETDLIVEIDTIDIPIYFLHGVFDYTVNYSLTKEYFNSLNAQIKGFYTFNNSAHSPIFEEPETVIRIILDDVLKKENNLSD